MNTELGYLPVGFPLQLYYLIISIVGILFFVFMKKDKLSVLLFLIFFGGVFAYWGELIDNTYKLVLVGLTLLLFFDKTTKYFNTKSLIIFFFFSGVFFISVYTNKNPILYSFSQYSKYLVPFLLSTYIFNNLQTIESNEFYLRFVLKLILLQVIFSFVKLFTIGFSESVVGSAAFMGGNPATFLPVLGLFIIYSISNGHLDKKNIVFLGSMLFISIMSFKRIIWFIYPIIFITLNYLWGNTRYFKYLVVLAPIIFYLGVRLNPTLNKENKIWGSFDLDYAINYAMEYSGISRTQMAGDIFIGRFAGNLQMLKFVGNNFSQFKTWFGYGPKAIYGMPYYEYQKTNWPWNIKHKGSLTGAARFLIAYGLFGVTFYLMLFSAIFYQNKNKKFSTFLIILFVVEFLFYLDTFILTFLMIPLILLSNYLSLLVKNSYLNFLNYGIHQPSNHSEIKVAEASSF